MSTKPWEQCTHVPMFEFSISVWNLKPKLKWCFKLKLNQNVFYWIASLRGDGCGDGGCRDLDGGEGAVLVGDLHLQRVGGAPLREASRPRRRLRLLTSWSWWYDSEECSYLIYFCAPWFTFFIINTLLDPINPVTTLPDTGKYAAPGPRPE